ncbi:hypothetical protein LTR17_010855 [Elasticomyces elasticus]|nr:hypothetical protein LTR17_010855 [Elasticomyces elasticus]
MEVVAGAASIAGLIGLPGQCISGAEKMISFCNQVRLAELHADRLKGDVNSLLRSLQDAAGLLERLEHDDPAIGAQAKISSLRYHLDDCDRAFSGWLAIVKKLQQKDRAKWFKQVWAAMNKPMRDDLHNELRRRRNEISLTLMTIGTTVNLRTSTAITELAPAVKATKQNLAILQRDLTASNTIEEAHFERLHANMENTKINLHVYCEANLSNHFQDLKNTLAPKDALAIDTVDTRILLKWIGAGRPQSLETWVRTGSWRRMVEGEMYDCIMFNYLPPWTGNGPLKYACVLCGYRDDGYDAGSHLIRGHGLGLGFGSQFLRGPCNKSFDQRPDAFCDHLREFHGPVLLDQQTLRDLVRSKFRRSGLVAETISSYDDSTTAKKVLALFPDAIVNSSKGLDGEDGTGEATDDNIAKNVVDFDLSKLKAEAEHRVLSASLEPMVAAPGTDAAVTTEQPEAMTLMQRSWNATLLEDWDSTHDRINKWMLHMLSSDCDGLAEVHRGYLIEARQKHTTSLTTSELSGRSWDRLVLKYWFLDEAALSIDALAAGRANAHLFDMPRGKGQWHYTRTMGK